MKKLITAITAAAMLAAPVFTNASAIDGEENVKFAEPVFKEFNPNDVSGGVVFNIPDNSELKVKITFASPETQNTLYYETMLSSTEGTLYAFDMEGYDLVLDENEKIADGRIYTIIFSAKDTELRIPSSEFTEETFTIPDSDNNGGKKKYEIYSIDFKVDDNEEKYSVETAESTFDGVACEEKRVTFFLDKRAIKGDVNEDGEVDAVDASIVLAEYARTSTGGKRTFTDRQFIAGDVNEDGQIDSVDASLILAYYAKKSTGGNPTW